MPYIPNEARVEIALNGEAETPGELNYILTVECLRYLEHNGESYQTMNDIVGALECAKLELYRRAVAPYEDEKIEANGDVFVFDGDVFIPEGDSGGE